MRSPFRELTLRNRLILAFLFLTLVPLVISGFLAVTSSSLAIQERIGQYSVQLMRQISVNTRTSLMKIKGLTDEVLISPDVNNYLLNYHQGSEMDRIEVRFIYSHNLQLKFLNVDAVDDIFMVFHNDGPSPGYDTVHTAVQCHWAPSDLERIMKENLKKENLRNLTLSLVTLGVDSAPDIVLSRRVGNILSQKVLGHLMVALNQNFFRDLFQDIDLGAGADLMILDEAGVVVFSRNAVAVPGQTYLPAAVFDRMKLPGGSLTWTDPRGERLLAYSRMQDLPWLVVASIPSSYLTAESSQVGLEIALFTFGILLLALAVAYRLARSFSSPLAELARKMEAFGEGDTSIQTSVDRRDEVGHLQRSFNRMASDIHGLLGRIEEEHRLRRMTELKLLEYQINPHFLYNSLDSINWMAQRAGHEDISSMATTLARFFRLGLSKGANVYRLKDELEHVECFLIICRIRFGDTFSYEIHVAPDLREVRTLKILLQPLVENTFKHGFVRLQRPGKLRIEARAEADGLVLEVADNGNGVAADRLAHLNALLDLASVDEVSQDGYGLANLQLRIRLHCGPRYGLKLASLPGEGTTVRVLLPWDLPQA